MNNLKPYPHCSKIAYDNSIKSKHKATQRKLRRLRAQVFKRYDSYINDLPTLKTISKPTIRSQQKDLYLGAYDSKTKEFRDILDEIRSIQETSFLRQYCQYCGINLSKSNDHYFPKEDYSHFAIFPVNLVPACIDCNGLKGSRIYLPTNERRFINFYYDNLVDKEFLECVVEYEDNLPVFTYGLEFDSNFDQGLKTIIEEHFINLKLLVQYKNISETEFEIISDEFCESNLVEQEVIDLLARKSRSYGKSYGYNHYKAALVRSLETNIGEFIVFLRFKFGQSEAEGET